MFVTRMKSLLLVGVLVGTAVVGMGCPTGVVVTFPDNRLELAVRNELRKPFGLVTQADMLSVMRLDARNYGIRDLRGIEKARNLFFLDVGNDQALVNSINDIDPIADLVNLTFVDFTNNDVSDITAISGLFNLDQLLLGGNPILTLGPIVANAENGGLGAGDIVAVSREGLLDEEGNTSPIIAEQIARLVALGVDLAIVEIQ
ncbi:MAG: hypothetical protein AAB353_00465 [Candidatus Hydrogenedentota bacterium]